MTIFLIKCFGVYQKEIDGFDPGQIKNNYKRLYEHLKGRYNKYKGEYSEYVLMTLLKHRAYKNNALFLSMINHGAYVQFRGSEFHTRNALFRQPQEQRRAKAHSRQAKLDLLKLFARLELKLQAIPVSSLTGLKVSYNKCKL